MTTPVDIICKQYLEVFPQEREALEPLVHQLKEHGPENSTSRNNFDTGHVTASVFIVTQPSKAILLIDHTFLKKQIQPGGHIEAEDESALAAAYRECQEETGISKEALTYIPLSEQYPDVPFNIEVQKFPARSSKNEPAHHHYDFWYLFTIKDGVAVASDDTGVANHQWVQFADFAENTEFSRQAEKIEKLLVT